MKIIKKNGKIEEFSSKKLITSIENAAKDVNNTLNESDLIMLNKVVIKKVEETRKAEDLTSSYEIVGIVIDTLKKEGFTNIIKAYIRYAK